MLKKIELLSGILALLFLADGVTGTLRAQVPATKHAKLRRWTNLHWGNREVPLFSIYGPFDVSPNASDLATAKSALDVFDFQEVTLAEDDKGITVRLTEGDRRVLARLAGKHRGKWFVAVAPPKDIYRGDPAVAATRMTSAMADGKIIFPHPVCGKIAQSLRRRFRIAEFRNSSR